MVADILLNRYVISVGIPLLLLWSGALAKKLVRAGTGGRGWRRQDLFMGVELTLSALSLTLLYMVEIVRALQSYPVEDLQDLLLTGLAYTVFVFFILYLFISWHQDWEHQDHDRAGQVVRLVFITNGVGTVLVAAAIILLGGPA
jgi:hypothetical protein